MKRSRLRTLALGAIVALGLAASPRFAHANTIETQIIPIDASFIMPHASALCGYNITWTITGTLRITSHLDASGTPVMDHGSYEHITFTFSGNGHSYSTPTTGVVLIDDSTGTQRDAGLYARFTLPGSGLIGIAAGTLVMDADGNVLFNAGPQMPDGIPLLLCQVLA